MLAADVFYFLCIVYVQRPGDQLIPNAILPSQHQYIGAPQSLIILPLQHLLQSKLRLVSSLQPSWLAEDAKLSLSIFNLERCTCRDNHLSQPVHHAQI